MQMDLAHLPEEIGHWKKEKVLGAGGFGFVILWQNKESNETIALKQCRWGHDVMMTPKHRSRWKLEVDMMFRLNHPNVVKAITVPPELDVPATEMPLLAMEYCSGGDLRKLLNKAENCCGLREKQVRLLLKHVSSAVNYLHSMRIIHRDLKPENIVIQESNGSVVFKLIDLGYAKELDQGSLCTSFVGTLQYLAPELFMSQKYSCTVDYWSLGLVTHEVITGLRPFLPDKSPAEWIPIIKQKSSSQIRALLDDDKNIVFSEEISPHHHICRTLKEDIESWLQLMLEYDPKKRGRTENTSAFIILEQILSKKVFHIFCLSNNFETLSFPANEVSTIEDLQNLLERKTGISVDDQEILLHKGTVPYPEKGISQFLNADDDVGAFLFNKNPHSQSLMPSTDIPPVVENMMRNPRASMKYLEQRAAWTHAIHLCQQEHLLVWRLMQAFRANLLHLLNKASNSHKSTSKMVMEKNKVCAKSEFLKSSLEQDLSSYETQAKNEGYIIQEMYLAWKNSQENLKRINILKEKIGSIEEQSASIDAQAMELQRTSYARSKQDNPLEEIYRKVLDVYNELKRRSKDQRHVDHDNADIVRLLCQYLQQSRSTTQDIVLLIRQSNMIKNNIQQLLPQISSMVQEIKVWDTQLENWQLKRQKEVWDIVNKLNDKIRRLESCSSPLYHSGSPQPALSGRYSTNSGHPSIPRSNLDSHLQNGHASPNSLNNVRIPVISIPVLKSQIESLTSGSAVVSDDETETQEQSPSIVSVDFSFLNSIFDKTIEESSQIKKENSELIARYQEMMSTLKIDPKLSGTNGLKNSSFEDKKDGNT